MKTSKNAKIAGVVVVVVLLLAAVLLISYLQSVNDYQKEIASLTISDIDVRSIPDGIYTGECDVDFIYAKVDVTVQGGKIADISIVEHKNGRGKAAEAILGQMIDEQAIDVDVIATATNSSKVIKKAVEEALLSGNH